MYIRNPFISYVNCSKLVVEMCLLVEATEQSLAYTQANDDREDEPNLERPVKNVVSFEW